MVKKVKKVKKKKSYDETKVTHAELNELILDINQTNLDMLNLVQVLTKDLDVIKEEIYNLHQIMYEDPEQSSKRRDQ